MSIHDSSTHHSSSRNHLHSHQEDDEAISHMHHDHHHLHAQNLPLRKLAIVFALTITVCMIEFTAGLFFKSLALIADAGHMLGDSAALAVAFVAQRIAQRERTRKLTFGFRRVEVLAAFLNGLALGGVAIGVLVEAAHRWNEPPMINARGVLVTATFGLIVNLIAAHILSQGTHHSHNANTRAALAHVVSDALGSIGAMASAGAMLIWHLKRVDAIMGILIAVLLVIGCVRLLKQTTSVLMEGAPSALNVAVLEAEIHRTPGVASVHDVHAWSISDGFDAVSAHIVLKHGFHGTDVAQQVVERIERRFDVNHITIQPEHPVPMLLPVHSLKRK